MIDLTKGNQIISYSMDWDELVKWADNLSTDKDIQVKVEENQINIWSKYGHTGICRVGGLE